MVIEDLLKAASDAVTLEHTYYTGVDSMVLKKLKDMPVDQKYPLISVLQPFTETIEGGWIIVRFPEITFGTKATTTDPPLVRTETVFKPILIPLYEEFMEKLSKQAGVIEREWHLWSKVKMNVPGSVTVHDKMEDVLDMIIVQDLIIKVNQKIC